MPTPSQSFSLGFKAKNLFFDRQAVIAAAGKTAAAALARQAGYIRTTAQRSMKSARTKKRRLTKAAKNRSPGKPPLVWRGHLKRLLWFAWDPSTRSAVVGPVKYKKGDVPELLEFGGTAIRRTPWGISFLAQYRPYPYMRPALEKSLERFADHWRNSIKRG